MKRLAENELLQWYKQAHRKPLVIRGARQVGKSTLVQNFCASKKIILYEINLEKYRSLNKVFESFDIEKILNALEDIIKDNINSENAVLFLDEIQSTPAALSALRYFYEERPDLAVIAAGSLLEFAIESGKYSLPVGRIEYFHLGPMSFSEFVLALDKTYLYEKYLENRSSRHFIFTKNRR